MKRSDSDFCIDRFYGRFLKVKVPLNLVVVLCVLSCILVWGLTFYSFKVVIGEVRVFGVGVGVYWDSNCDNPVTSLSWGKIVVSPLRPEEYKNVTIYLRNEGSVPAVMRLNASDWSPPSVEKYMCLSWNYDDRVLGVDEVVRVMLVLSVDSKIWFESPRIQDFSFDIIISASSS